MSTAYVYTLAVYWKELPFYLALLAAILFWWLYAMVSSVPLQVGESLAKPGQFIVLALLYPVLEELVFRGWIQGRLLQPRFSRSHLPGITDANIYTSLFFMSLHFFSHPPLWALAVLVPSLIFGYFRDRYQSVKPSIFLHIFYNAGFLLLFS